MKSMQGLPFIKKLEILSEHLKKIQEKRKQEEEEARQKAEQEKKETEEKEKLERLNLSLQETP